MELPTEATVARKMTLLLKGSPYLEPGNAEFKSPARHIDHKEASNATGPLLDILHSHAVQSTLSQSFDGNASTIDGMEVFPGALLMGRLFSYVARIVALKHRAPDGTLDPVNIDSISYAALNDDERYMCDLAAAITHEGSEGWTLEAETFHVARGVEAFFRGCVTINVDDSPKSVYFMGSVSEPRNLFLRGVSGGEENERFKRQKNSFAYWMIPDSAESGQPPRINKTEDDESRETRLAYVRQHIWSVQRYFDKRLRPLGKRKRTGEAGGMATAVDSSSVDNERDRVAQRLRAEAATVMTTPHAVVPISTISKSKEPAVSVYAETPLSEATYDRYLVEQQRVADRINALEAIMTTTKSPPLFVHDATPMMTSINSGLIRNRDAKPFSAEATPESLALLETHTKFKTVPIYMNVGKDHRVPSEALKNISKKLTQHGKNMELLSRVFREVRRMTTLMYLLWDKETEELKNAKVRVSSKESFLKLLNSGKDNNGFVFTSFDDANGYPSMSGARRLDADQDPVFTKQDAQQLCTQLNTIPDYSGTDKETKRVERTVFRVPRLWQPRMMETTADTGRVVAQYAYASAHDVGAKTAGGYLFHGASLFDEKLFEQWDLLYTPFNGQDYERKTIDDLRTYLVAMGRVASDERQRELEAKDKELESHKRDLDAKEKELDKRFAQLEGWWDELRDTGHPGDGEFASKVDQAAAEPVDQKETFEEVINLSRRFWHVRRDTVEAYDVYNAIQGFRLWRRNATLEKAKRVPRGQRHEGGVDFEWFYDTFGVSTTVYYEREVACGGTGSPLAQRLLQPKKQKPNPSSFNDEKKWGVMFVNEFMLYEFGDTNGYAPKGSVMSKVQKATAETSTGINTALRQFQDTEVHMDALWKLLAKMSSVGILNVDAHLGNYMLTDYDQNNTMYAKAIDVDASYTTVFTKEDLVGSGTTPNPEGWKPLYVLNVLLVLYTLAQDPSRAQLYSLFINANRKPENPDYIEDRLYTLKTKRADQFKGIVYDTIRALERTPRGEWSVPQQLLAASWHGAYRGMGGTDGLKLPTAFFSNKDIQELLLGIAELNNNRPNIAEEERTELDREVKTKMDRVFKIINEDAAIEKLGDGAVNDAIAILQSLDATEVTSSRGALKVPAAGATHFSQMEWALRLNLFDRGFIQPAHAVCQRWAERQHEFYRTLQQAEEAGRDDWKGAKIDSTSISKLVAIMTPNSARQFHNVNSFFNNLYKHAFAPMMHHTVKAREDYRVIDLLYDYVFAPTFGKEVGEGMTNANLMPRMPDLSTAVEDNTPFISRYQTWRRQVPNDARGILGLPAL